MTIKTNFKFKLFNNLRQNTDSFIIDNEAIECRTERGQSFTPR